MQDMMADVSASEELSEDIVESILSAAEEADARELWLPKARGITLRVLPRLFHLLHASTRLLPEDGGSRRMIRQNALKILAYTQPNVRLATLLDLAIRDRRALRDLLTGRLDSEYEPYRYNILTSLAIFSRHGLMRSVTTPERIGRVSESFARARALRSTAKDGEER